MPRLSSPVCSACARVIAHRVRQKPPCPHAAVHELALHGQCVQKWTQVIASKDGTAYLFDTRLGACSEAALRCPAQAALRRGRDYAQGALHRILFPRPFFAARFKKKTERLKAGQVFQTRGQSSQTQQAAMRTYTKAGLVGLALLSSAEVRDSGTQSPMSPRLRVRKTPEGWSPRLHALPFAVPPGSPTQRACGGGNHSH